MSHFALLSDQLDSLRIHMVIAHNIKKNGDCQKSDSWHWNKEMSELVDKIKMLERIKEEYGGGAKIILDAIKAIEGKSTT